MTLNKTETETIHCVFYVLRILKQQRLRYLYRSLHYFL